VRERWLALLLTPLLFVAVWFTALWYAADRAIPLTIVHAAFPAFLLEAVLYVLAGLEPVQARVAAMRPAAAASLLIGLSPVSWLLLTIPLQLFDAGHLAALVVLATVAAFWFVILPRHDATDLGFLVLMAAPILAGMVETIYPDPAPRLPGQILGALMWYRTGLVAVLSIRRMEGIGFGFIPRRREWEIGVRNFIWFLPLGGALAAATSFVRLRDIAWDGRTLLLAILTFVGVLWVLAVAEEFFFRGLLQQQLSRLLGSNVAGLILASAIFGAAHLGYREFPNWRFALLAMLAGIFYGRAYLQGRGIRAAMVTHALVVTTWKIFLT
jgi:uncharacterized protein